MALQAAARWKWWGHACGTMSGSNGLGRVLWIMAVERGVKQGDCRGIQRKGSGIREGDRGRVWGLGT